MTMNDQRTPWWQDRSPAATEDNWRAPGADASRTQPLQTQTEQGPTGGSAPYGSPGQYGSSGEYRSPGAYGGDAYGNAGHSGAQYGSAGYGAAGYGSDAQTPTGFGPGQGDAFGSRPQRRNSPGWKGVILASLGSALLASTLAVGGASLLNDEMPGPTTQTAPADSSGAGQSVPMTADGAVDWAAVAEKVSPSVVSIQVNSGMGGGTGSGSIIDDQGHILTNHHVVAAGGAASQISVVLSDGRVFQNVEVVGSDATSDLAVLKIPNPPVDLTPVLFGDSAKVQPGQPVMAIGSPLGLADTATTGIVSAVDRPVIANQEGSGRGSSSDLVVNNAIQTDAAINPGNSGGVLVDATGSLIGIPSSINTLAGSSGTGGSIGLGFAIPSNQAKRIADDLISTGRAQHAWLGVSLTTGVASVDGQTRMGAALQEVQAGTPAADAGLRQGDVVLSIDGEPVVNSDALVAQIKQRAPGTQTQLEYARDGQRHTVDVTLDATPG